MSAAARVRARGPALASQLELRPERFAFTNLTTTARKVVPIEKVRGTKIFVLQADDGNAANLDFDVLEAMDRPIELVPSDVHVLDAPAGGSGGPPFGGGKGRDVGFVFAFDVWLKMQSATGGATVWLWKVSPG